jgi:hypothetical protein
VLIDSVLSSLPMFMMPFFKVPRGVLKKIEYFRSRFFWQNDEHKRKYRLTKWNILCQPKEQGCKCNQDLLWVLALMTTKLED